MISSKKFITKVLVKEAEAKSPWDWRHQILYDTLLGEGVSEGVDGVKLILDTLTNRFNKSGLPTWIEALKNKQYSMWNRRIENPSWRPETPTTSQALGSATSNLVRQAVDNIYEPGTDFTHYYNPDLVTNIPGWSSGEPGTRIGNHLFFSDIAPYKK